MSQERTLKYTNYLTVSFPQSIMDLINQHCWEVGMSKQDFVRQAVKNEFTLKYQKDVDLVVHDKIKKYNNL